MDKEQTFEEAVNQAANSQMMVTSMVVVNLLVKKGVITERELVEETDRIMKEAEEKGPILSAKYKQEFEGEEIIKN